MNFLKSLSTQHQGYLALLMGLILLLGAVDRLGIFQKLLMLIMVIASLLLIVWGLDKSNVIPMIRKKIKK